MAKTGRKRKDMIARHPNGQPKRAAPSVRAENVRKVVLDQPHRRIFGEAAGSHYAGTVAGRLLMHKKITKEQLTAIQMAGRIIGRHLATVGGPVTDASPLWRFVKDDFAVEYAPQDAVDHVPMTQEERDIRAKERYDELTAILLDNGAFEPGMRLIARVELADRELHEHEIGDLRVAANHLVRVWKLGVDEAPPLR